MDSYEIIITREEKSSNFNQMFWNLLDWTKRSFTSLQDYYNEYTNMRKKEQVTDFLKEFFSQDEVYIYVDLAEVPSSHLLELPSVDKEIVQAYFEEMSFFKSITDELEKITSRIRSRKVKGRDYHSLAENFRKEIYERWKETSLIQLCIENNEDKITYNLHGRELKEFAISYEELEALLLRLAYANVPYELCKE